MNPGLANHLWQSTLFAAVASVLAMAFRKNSAGVRHSLWLAASLKFLIPFSALAFVGSYFGHSNTPAASSQVPAFFNEISQPFSASSISAAAPSIALPAASLLPMMLLAVWLGGGICVVLFWWRRWRGIATLVRESTPASEPLAALCRIGRRSIPVRVSAAAIEPGIFGIFRPILLLPAGIADRLDDAQLRALIAHELCHVGRRDNLTASIHMLVEAIFWFHPLVWWLGARLVEERECACDEEVLRLGNPPQTYAEGILRVCRFYLESPLACLSGVSGANLKRRIEGIMSNRAPRALNRTKRAMLASLAAAALAGPVAIGLIYAPLGRAQQPVENASKVSFDVATIKPNQSFKERPTITYESGQVRFGHVSLESAIGEAYSLKPYQIVGPQWIQNEAFDIVAKAAQAAPESQLRLMLRSLLEERFKMAVHREKRELPVFAMRIVSGGPKFAAAADPDHRTVGFAEGGLKLQGYSMPALAEFLTRLPPVGRPVLDETGLNGAFDMILKMSDLQPNAEPADMKRGIRDWNSIFTDVQTSLGIKLESRKSEIDVLVIDRAEKVPTEN